MPNVLSAPRTALVRVIPAKRGASHEFHRVEIAGQIFVGEVCAFGPYIRKDSRRWGADSYLGPISTLNQIRDGDGWLQGKPGGWYICKYENQPHIYLEGMSADCRDALMAEFGLGLAGHRAPPVNPFFSPAFAGLAAWSKKHPRLAKSCSDNSPYLRGWLERLPAPQD